MIIYGNGNHVYGGQGLYFGQYDPVYTLTCQTDGHGTLTASVLTGHSGDTVSLSPTYNTYYRFNNYSVTGGTIAGNTFTFGNEDATAQANFKVNYFTASGSFEKGSNVQASITNYNSDTKTVATKYAIHGAHTGDIPASWYSTSNRWKPNSVSSYSITLHPIMVFQYNSTYTSNANNKQCTAISLIGSTTTQSQSFSQAGKTVGVGSFTYNKTFTSTTQNVNYGISAKLYVSNGYAGYPVTVTYSATKTTGTWTATGIAP